MLGCSGLVVIMLYILNNDRSQIHHLMKDLLEAQLLLFSAIVVYITYIKFGIKPKRKERSDGKLTYFKIASSENTSVEAIFLAKHQFNFPYFVLFFIYIYIYIYIYTHTHTHTHTLSLSLKNTLLRLQIYICVYIFTQALKKKKKKKKTTIASTITQGLLIYIHTHLLYIYIRPPPKTEVRWWLSVTGSWSYQLSKH